MVSGTSRMPRSGSASVVGRVEGPVVGAVVGARVDSASILVGSITRSRPRGTTISPVPPRPKG